MAQERLQKILAGAGVASRRASEELITAGRVSVNGHTVTELGSKFDPEVVQITVDGKPIKFHKRHIYLKLHKPRGVISDVGGDTRGRQSVADLLPPDMRRLFPVGRLDLNSEGLILMTDDGDLANKLSHPRYEHPKTYYVLLGDRPAASGLEQLRQGVELSDGMTAPAEVRVVQSLPQGIRLAQGPTSGIWLEIILREGKKRQIRHMTAAIGFPTLRLIRWAIGPLKLDDLKPGESTPLLRKEVAALINALREGGKSQVARPVAATRRPRGEGAAKERPESDKDASRSRRSFPTNRSNSGKGGSKPGAKPGNKPLRRPTNS
jgi:23S rRNA pseudouridine2605 synthase